MQFGSGLSLEADDAGAFRCVCKQLDLKIVILKAAEIRFVHTRLDVELVVSKSHFLETGVAGYFRVPALE